MLHMPQRTLSFGRHEIGEGRPVFFIADIAANHDGDLSRAEDLIGLAAEAGADAAKFQHFAAETIVSDYGFRNLGSQQSHQASWSKSVFEVYKDASLPDNWTPALKRACDDAGIAFFTSPYSFELVDAVNEYVEIFKIGSGDITWLEIIRHICGKGKPVLLATGASSIDEVSAAVDAMLEITPMIGIMQCNTNYVASPEQFKHVNLNVLKTYAKMWPDAVLGLSDHTLGCAATLGAVALGAKVIEKHFTDDRERIGPDHSFSMTPRDWREMVERTRELEAALGSSEKKVEENESRTFVLQRRALRAAVDIPQGGSFTRDNLVALRPCPEDALPPGKLEDILSRTARKDIPAGAHISWTDIDWQ
ncbi:MAG: N,N'-diacetyllegionaminic acid synthase [bacterium ADurb.Bin236]|nr:MAG: N,N'-diacetyllegionaminic acid synthase [bacterium ADurb.Bin236]